MHRFVFIRRFEREAAAVGTAIASSGPTVDATDAAAHFNVPLLLCAPAFAAVWISRTLLNIALNHAPLRHRYDDIIVSFIPPRTSIYEPARPIREGRAIPSGWQGVHIHATTFVGAWPVDHRRGRALNFQKLFSQRPATFSKQSGVGLRVCAALAHYFMGGETDRKYPGIRVV